MPIELKVLLAVQIVVSAVQLAQSVVIGGERRWLRAENARLVAENIKLRVMLTLAEVAVARAE